MDEFKSSSYIRGNPERLALRDDFHRILADCCGIGVVVVPTASELGPESMRLLSKIMTHPDLATRDHDAYLDEGLFRSAQRGREVAAALGPSERCALHFEQSSVEVAGIQLADLAAHTCATMLLDTLGLISKPAKAAESPGYDPDVDVRLGFELWARIRYNFIGAPAERDQTTQQPVADIRPYGLHISATVNERLRQAVVDRFGTMYVGCIH